MGRRGGGRDPIREQYIARKRDLNEEKRYIQSQITYINGEIQRLYDLINAADRRDRSMRDAIDGWYNEIRGLKAERESHKYTLDTIRGELDFINSQLGPRY